MPLLTSPIDGSAMLQIRRHGVELDVCPTSGGVWLDKGELEKLVALMAEDASGMHADRRRTRRYGDDDDDFDDRSYPSRRQRSRLMDIFDF